MSINEQGVSIVVPTFNSPSSLRPLCDEIENYVGPLFDKYEIIFVDDGNTDGTWSEIKDLHNSRSCVSGIRLLRNYGQHNALLAGLKMAKFPLILTLDDDLQNPPQEVEKMVRALTDEVDLVYGFPTRATHSRVRDFISSAAKKIMSKLLGPDIFPKSSAFRLFRSDLLQAGDKINDPYLSIDVMLSWATSRIESVQVDFAERYEGSSGYNFRKLVHHALNMVTGYSTRPLRLFGAFGILFSLSGFCLFLYVLIASSLGKIEVPGFSLLACSIEIFSGVQLLGIGVIGEYLARLHYRSMGKPIYLAREEVVNDD